MKGTRPRNTDEIRRVSHCFDGTYATRNRGLFMLGSVRSLLSHTLGYESGPNFRWQYNTINRYKSVPKQKTDLS